LPPGADIVIEYTGVEQIVIDAMRSTSHGGIVCLAGISSGVREIRLNVVAFNSGIVLENDAEFGSVNADMRHYKIAAETLAPFVQWCLRV